MPELPEVETIVRMLQSRLTGRKVQSVRVLRQDLLRTARGGLGRELAGQSILGVERRGKKILIRVKKGVLCIHLGMSGQLTLAPPQLPCARHTHVALRLRPGAERPEEELRFRDARRFGRIWWLADARQAEAGLGPEALSLKAEELHVRLARTQRPIKAALLDQSLVAGLGNIYADESLYMAGIHPLRRACDLDLAQVRALNRAIRTVLRSAIRHRGSSLRDYVDVDGLSGGYQSQHRVYGRRGQPCQRCGTPIACVRIHGRSSHYCPGCQRLENPGAAR